METEIDETPRNAEMARDIFHRDSRAGVMFDERQRPRDQFRRWCQRRGGFPHNQPYATKGRCVELHPSLTGQQTVKRGGGGKSLTVAIHTDT